MGSLSVSKIKQNLNSEIMGNEIILLDKIESTNDYAKDLARNGIGEGVVVLSSCQTGGKGRMGRSFFSPKDKGIYMSVILKPEIMIEKSLLITSFAAFSTAKAIERLAKAEVKIKWVNDLYLNGKKVCGILTEGKLSGDKMEYVVLGIGLNVKKEEFPPEISNIATSLENETEEDIDMNVLSAFILEELDKLYKTFGNGDFLKENEVRSNLMGEKIKVIRGNETYNATAMGLDENGGLIIDKDGEKMVLSSGEVSVRVEEKCE